MEEPIHSFPIHNLPESLILQCLARLHLKDLPIASRVCRKWLHLIGSRHFYTLRRQLGCANQLACLLQQLTPPSLYNLKYGINIFDPMNREWNRLPQIPNFPHKLPWLTLIASSEGKLAVFSYFGQTPINPNPVMSMFVLDFATQRWRKGNGMPLITSSKFSMAASQCHGVFIGSDLDGEMGDVFKYDVWKDECTLLHRVIGGQIIWMRVIEEELWVILRSKGIQGFKEYFADVYHFQTNERRRVELDLEEFNELLYPLPDIELYELMKKLCENELIKILEQCSRLQLGKQSLLMAPTFNEGCYDGEVLFYMQGQDGYLEKIQPPISDFSEHVESWCCVEL